MIEQLQEDLKAAMRAKDKDRLRTIRSLRAALLEREIELRATGKAVLTDDEALTVLQKQAKKRRDAIDQYVAAGRDDLAHTEQVELDIITAYLPAQASDAEIETHVQDIIRKTGAQSLADMGKVMGVAMQALKGKADGKRISAVVKKMLRSEQ